MKAFSELSYQVSMKALEYNLILFNWKSQQLKFNCTQISNFATFQFCNFLQRQVMLKNCLYIRGVSVFSLIALRLIFNNFPLLS